jgi:hypothetical protein
LAQTARLNLRVGRRRSATFLPVCR